MRLFLCSILLASVTASACNSNETPSAPTSTPSAPTVITFRTFPGFDAGPYSESGATVTPISGARRSNSYGNPGPATVFPGFLFEAPPTAGKLAVMFGARAFKFTAVDVYSSVTQIPWEFRGYLNRIPVFTVDGRQGNTFGRFVRVDN